MFGLQAMEVRIDQQKRKEERERTFFDVVVAVAAAVVNTWSSQVLMTTIATVMVMSVPFTLCPSAPSLNLAIFPFTENDVHQPWLLVIRVDHQLMQKL